MKILVIWLVAVHWQPILCLGIFDLRKRVSEETPISNIYSSKKSEKREGSTHFSAANEDFTFSLKPPDNAAVTQNQRSTF
jgi:hypothetical protein